MATNLDAAPAEHNTGSLRKQKRRFRTVAYGFMIVYALVTLFPFYILFIRTFVSTKDSTELHLWIPRSEDLSMDAEIGNLAVNYNIDIKKLKDDLGIKGYLNPRQSLAVIAEKNNIPIERFERYFANFGTFNGWITLLGRADDAKRELVQMPAVVEVSDMDEAGGRQRLRVAFDGEDQVLTNMIQALAAQNIPVLNFNEEAHDLESVFMRVTKGIVS